MGSRLVGRASGEGTTVLSVIASARAAKGAAVLGRAGKDNLKSCSAYSAHLVCPCALDVFLVNWTAPRVYFDELRTWHKHS